MVERSRSEAIGIVVLVACVLLAGCSGGGPSGTATTSAAGSDTTAPASPSTVTAGTTSTDDRTTTQTMSETTEPSGTTRTKGTTGTGPETEDGTTPPARGTSRSALVTRVVDGDTIEIRYPNGTTDTVRLLGVDTPEVSGDVSPEEFEGIPDTEAGRAHLQEWATRASAFAREELSGARVQVVTNPQADRRGRYGRLLAYVVRSDGNRTDGGDDASEGEASESSGEDGSFNAALLREGYARVYDSSFSERERYEALETRAKERNVGLWRFDGEERTEEPNSGLTIARIQADVPGDDNERPNGEYVVENRGVEAIDLSGRQVTDEAEHTYLLPEGTTLAPGARPTLYSGRGEDRGTELYWGSAGAIRNDGGDTVTIRTESGSVAVRRTYTDS